MSKTLVLLALLVSINCFGEIEFRDSIKFINGVNYKITYAINKTDDTVKYVYHNNSEVLTDILEIYPHSISITGFKQSTIVNKVQTKNNDIVKILKSKKIKFDTTKVKSNEGK